MSQFGNGIGNVHNDVLQANPTDDASKERLIEEIKNRAKGSLASKNYPEAVALYSKAIELRPNDAILFANRSLCNLSMSKPQEALSDADKAVEYDNTYVKGYYRKGMALIGLQRYSAAREALQKGHELAPDDKSFITQLDKLRGDAYQHDGSSSTSAKSTSTAPLPKLPAKVPPKKKDATTEKDEDEGAEKGGKKVDTSLRGYKTTSDGRKTTFF